MSLLVILFVLLLNVIYYTFFIPHPAQKPLKLTCFNTALGRAAYLTAYILSLLRAPLGLLPYLVKLFIFFVLRIRYESAQSTYFRELINMGGDGVNLAFTALLILLVFGPPRMELTAVLLYLPVGAELVRLIAERVPLTFSVLWQMLPHRRVAHLLQSHHHTHRLRAMTAACLSRYCAYYALSDTGRAAYLLRAL